MTDTTREHILESIIVDLLILALLAKQQRKTNSPTSPPMSGTPK